MLGRKRQRLLLPADRQIIEILGVTEQEYRDFLLERERFNRQQPIRGPVAVLDPVTILLINLAISLVLTAASYLLRPRPLQPKKPGELRQQQSQGQSLVTRTEFTPKQGISSSQDVVELGATIPVIWANRETIGGVTYGGVRVNCPMIWSQMYSLGGSQMLRAIYLVGEAPVNGIDPQQFAFGENLLSSYDLGTAGESSARVTIYHRPGGGRIRSSDRVAGRLAANDPGNSENAGAGDVFQARGLNNAWTQATSYTYRPSSQTIFGLYSPIGNGLAYRLNPSMRPASTPSTVQASQYWSARGYSQILCSPDHSALVQRQKNDAISQSRSGLVTLRRNGSVIVSTSLLAGDELDYLLDSGTSAAESFVSGNFSELKGDIGAAVAGRQRQWDDSIIVGETYRIGSAIAVCKSRTPSDDVFSSDVQSQPIGGGISIVATFTIVSAGSCDFPGSSGARCGTSSPHIMRLSRATIAIPQPAQVIEVGGKSAVGIRVSGFCNIKDSPSYRRIDLNACDIYDTLLLAPRQILETTAFQSGTITQIETRYSFWRFRYRMAGSSSEWSQFPQLFGVSGSTQQQQYWYNRIEFPSRQRWELDYLPVSGWEIRNNVATGQLVVIDARLSTLLTLTDGAAVMRVPGTFVDRQQSEFQMPCTIPSVGDIGIPYVDSSNIVDDWGRLAEQFVYEEFTTSCTTPEHEIAYINVIDTAPTPPSYENITLVAVNIRSTTESSTLGQFSVYVNQGISSSHSFPGLLEAGLTNSRYGVGSIMSALQVDSASFQEATAWTRARGYFWDGALADPVNMRSWGNDTAALFLLDLVTKNGVSYLQPAILFDQPEAIVGLFNLGVIKENTFKLNYFDQADRQPIRVSIKWREERRAEGDGSNRGLFPVIREVTTREASTSETALLETIDMTDFCTNEIHAIDVGKIKARMKRLITHQVTFEIPPLQATLVPGRCFKLAMESVSYSAPSNGVILKDGSIIKGDDSFADGTYDVLLWTGSGGIQETQITIVNGKALNAVQAVFCIAEVTTSEPVYKVQSMGFTDTGDIQVTALSWPLDSNGYSQIASGWDISGNWIIEGVIGNTDAPGSITTSFTGVTIVGSSTATVGVSENYSAIVSGTGTGYTYSWSGSGLTFGTPVSPSTTITVTSAGAKTASCAVTRNGVTITATLAILGVTGGGGSTTIGAITISGSAGGASPATISYSSANSGSATDLTYSWSAAVIPSTGLVTFNQTDLQTVAATFTGAGAYQLSCRVRSYTASDDSVQKSCTFNLTADTITANAHTLSGNDQISFTALTGALPTGIIADTIYYVRSSGITANTFTISALPSGSLLDISGSATGTYQVTRIGRTGLITVTIT
jgi:hypothetical protein